MTDLTTLAARVEAGTAEMQLQLIADAALSIGDSWTKEKQNTFLNYMEGGAYLDAALMLVPEGWSIGVGDLRGYTPPIWRAHLRDHRPGSLTEAGHSHIWREGNARTSIALALAAAALRARASEAAHG